MNLHQILLRPTDVLFFRDGRPMSGSLAGHTASWPLPDVTNHALYAALHRAGLEGVHTHRRGRSGIYADDQRDRKFGSLATAGPFPVGPDGTWFFPRPKDAQAPGSVDVTYLPVDSLASADGDPWAGSSLPSPLRCAVGNLLPPDKASAAEPWLSQSAFHAYLRGTHLAPAAETHAFLRDDAIADVESTLGIAIDPETQTTGSGDATGKIYTAHYLRLRDGFRLGVLATASDKDFHHAEHGNDLIRALLNGHPTHIVVGGQQRLCTAEAQPLQQIPLPFGFSQSADFIRLPNGKYAVKWVLLSPAVWPEIPALTQDGRPQAPHPGGWLPNWVFLDWDPPNRTARPSERNGEVLLTAGLGVRKAQRKRAAAGGKIRARLVSAIVPKPLVVTGWALPSAPDADGGAKPTHLAVPPGAIYYFEAEGADEAAKLAAALNWHGDAAGRLILNRRSTLLGEKGYGLGACGTWRCFPNVAGRPQC